MAGKSGFKRFIGELGTTAWTLLLTVAYHWLYAICTVPNLGPKLKDSHPVEFFNVVQEKSDVHFDLFLAAIMLALGSRKLPTVVRISILGVFLSLLGAWIGALWGHNPLKPFSDGAALLSLWGPNLFATIMFLFAATLVSQSSAATDIS